MSVDEILNPEKIHLCPNPVNGSFQISGLTTTEKYKITNTSGIEIASGTISENQK